MEKCVEVSGTTLVIKVPRELDHHSAEYLRGEADRILGEKSIRSIVFDFEKTSFMDSSGIAVVLRTWKRMQEVDGTMTLWTVPACAAKVLRAAGVDKPHTVTK